MRWAALSLLVIASIAVQACGGDGGDRPPVTPAAATATPSAAVRTEQPTTPGPTLVPGAVVEVAGIVGAVSGDRRSITITRLSGADVNRIEITAETELRRAGGGRITASEIRPSDRIVARGQLDGARGSLLADDITVQAVVPGGAPGG